MNLSSLRPALNRSLSRLGIPGIAGIGLLLFSLGLYESAIAPKAAEVAALREKIAKLQRFPQAAKRSAGEGPLSDFYAFFPPQASLPQWLGKVYELGESENLSIPKGEYRLVRGPDESISAYQAVFPVKGTYEQVRRFVAGVLNEMPFVSLDDLRLEKQRAADPVVDSRIRLTIYLRAP